MDATLATEPTRQQAVDAVRYLKRPSEMSRTQWRSVRRVLMVVAKYYPKSCPAVPRIAEEAKLSVRQVQRILTLAEGVGMLVTEHDAGLGRHHISKTNRYHIVAVMGDISGDEMSYISTPSEYPLPTVVGTSSGAVPSAQRAAVAASGPWEEPSVVRDPEPEEVEPDLPPDDWRQTVPEVNKHGNRKRPVESAASRERKRRPSEVEKLVEYFLVGWKQVTDAHPKLKTERVGAANEIGGYIKTTLLAGKSVTYTPDEVKMMMDHFFQEVAAGRLSIRPGQWVWRRFVGTWSPNILPKAKASDNWYLETQTQDAPLEQEEDWWS